MTEEPKADQGDDDPGVYVIQRRRHDSDPFVDHGRGREDRAAQELAVRQLKAGPTTGLEQWRLVHRVTTQTVVE